MQKKEIFLPVNIVHSPKEILNSIDYSSLIKWVEDAFIYIMFKINEPIKIFEAFLKRISEKNEIKFSSLPNLGSIINYFKKWKQFSINDFLDEILRISCFSSIYSMIKENPGFYDEFLEEMPIFSKWDKIIDAIIEEITQLFKNPSVYFSLLKGISDNDEKLLDIIEDFINSINVDRLNEIYKDIKLPMTTVIRSEWFRKANITMYSDLKIVEIFQIIFLFIKNKKIKKETAPKEGIEKIDDTKETGLNNILKLIVKYLQYSRYDFNQEELSENLKKLKNNSQNNGILDEFIHIINFYKEHKSDESDFSIPFFKIIMEIINLKESKEDFSNIGMEDIFDTQNITQEDFIPFGEKIIEQYSRIKEEQDLEDIILDYLWRYNFWIENNFKYFLSSIDNYNSKKQKSSQFITFGQLIKKLDPTLKEGFQKLLDLRNSIAHGSIKIKINKKNIYQSLISFPKSEKRSKSKPKSMSKSKIEFHEMIWKDLLNFTLEWYSFFLSILRKIRERLIVEKKIAEGITLLDTPQKEFQERSSFYFEQFKLLIESIKDKFHKD